MQHTQLPYSPHPVWGTDSEWDIPRGYYRLADDGRGAFTLPTGRPWENSRWVLELCLIVERWVEGSRREKKERGEGFRGGERRGKGIGEGQREEIKSRGEEME
jgi:hypothetical protein